MPKPARESHRTVGLTAPALAFAAGVFTFVLTRDFVIGVAVGALLFALARRLAKTWGGDRSELSEGKATPRTPR